MPPLKNARWEAFCLNYRKSGNATQSVKDAGYAAKTEGSARTMAYRLLTYADIQERLRELAEEEATEKIADAREIQERLTAILRMETKEETVVMVGLGEGVSVPKTVEKAPALKDVIKAGETLAKMQGAFDNSVKLEMTLPVFGGEGQLED